MNKLDSFNIMPFQWSFEDELLDSGLLQCIIRCYGWNEKNESVYCNIYDFDIPIWVELPEDIEWTESKMFVVCEYLKNMNNQRGYSPVYIRVVNKHKLYYAEIEKISGKHQYQKKKFPFLEIAFRSTKALSQFCYKLKQPIMVSGLTNKKVQFKCHSAEASITPVLKLFAFADLPSSNWINCKGKKVLDDDKESTKQHEYLVSYKQMKGLNDEICRSMPIVYPKVLSFDNEAYSAVDGSMPNANKPSDKVFMIGASVLEQKGKSKTYTKYILTLGNPDPVDGAIMRKFKSEADLYVGFTTLIDEINPDVIIGYNIFGWDIGFMVDRAGGLLQCLNEFDKLGCIYGKHAQVKEINWESSAYGKQELKYFDAEGRLFIDLLPYIKRNYKFANYRLETVCEEVLKDSNKDPLKAKDIFRGWREQDPKQLSMIAKYCIQDTWVVIQLYEKMLLWFDLVESATTNGVPIFYLYTKGQQIKMYSQLLKYCVHNNIVVQSNAIVTKEDEQYSGAYVAEPKAGVYKMILPFDFASLYPSIIQAYNIDYSKLVVDESIPDDLCHIFEWSEHSNCSHDPEFQARKAKILDKKKKKADKNGLELTQEEEDEDPSLRKNDKYVCASYKYRFLKAEVVGKGVIPTLLETLLSARKATRKIIERNEDTIKEMKEKSKYLQDSNGNDTELEIERLEEMNQVLDKRQLAYKVSANSMYGAMGVKKGYLPFLPGAMCVTSTGRTAIQKASDYLEKECGGEVIYNDTDSAYTYFPCLEGKSTEEVWDYAEEVVEKVKKLFPAPMKLEFEGKAYLKFLILTKKRYCAIACDRDGKIKKGLVKRGIVLQRRDNCKFLRDLYEKCIYTILDNIDDYTKLSKEMTQKEIMNTPSVTSFINQIMFSIDELFQRKYNPKDFVITKGLTKLDYKSKTDPAHVHLAKKMINRGVIVPVGSRLEYLLLDNGKGYDKNEKQLEQVEDITYFLENREILRINYLEYLKRQALKPIDELLRVSVHLNGMIDQHFKLRIQKSNVNQTIKKIFKPTIEFLD